MHPFYLEANIKCWKLFHLETNIRCSFPSCLNNYKWNLNTLLLPFLCPQNLVCPFQFKGALYTGTCCHIDMPHLYIVFLWTTRRYSPLRGLTSISCGGLRPSAEGFFCPSGKKRAYYTVLAHFWQFLVSSSNLGNF